MTINFQVMQICMTHIHRHRFTWCIFADSLLQPEVHLPPIHPTSIHHLPPSGVICVGFNQCQIDLQLLPVFYNGAWYTNDYCIIGTIARISIGRKIRKMADNQFSSDATKTWMTHILRLSSWAVFSHCHPARFNVMRTSVCWLVSVSLSWHLNPTFWSLNKMLMHDMHCKGLSHLSDISFHLFSIPKTVFHPVDISFHIVAS